MFNWHLRVDTFLQFEAYACYTEFQGRISGVVDFLNLTFQSVVTLIVVLILFFSANNGNVDVIECLLNAGAKIDARTEWGDLPIHYAACWGTHQVLEYLFEEGSPVDKPAAGKQTH